MINYPTSNKGVTDAIGYILVLAIVFGSIIAVYSVGFDLLDTQRNIEVDENINRTLNVFLTNEQEVFAGAAPSRSTEIKLADNEIQLEKDTSSLHVYLPSKDTSHVSSSGRIHFSSPQGSYIHEFSGLIREQDNSNITQMEEAPETMITYDASNNSMHIHMYGSVMRNQTYQGGIRNVVVTRSQMNSNFYTFSSPEEVEIYVVSPNQNLWAEYLSSQDGIDSCEPSDINQVVCTTEPLDEVSIQQTDVNIQAT